MFNQKTKMSFTLERALNLLRIIEKREKISQREVAEFMDVSLGTANQTGGYRSLRACNSYNFKR